MPKFKYQPKGNRTPVSHPIYGHLVWGEIYDNPELANDPDFVEVKDEPAPDKGKKTPAAAKGADAGQSGKE